MLSDPYNSLKVYLHDKNTSPLFGSVLISWSAWNYKFILLILSKLSYPEKLEMIDVIYNSSYDLYITAILGPLLTAFLYIFVFPFPSKFVFEYSLKRQDELNKIKQRISNNQLITLEKSQTLRKRISELNIEHAKELEENESKIEFLTKKNSELESEIINLKKKLFDNAGNIEKPINIEGNYEQQKKVEKSYLEMAEDLILDFFDDNENELVNKTTLLDLLYNRLHLKKYLIEKIFSDLLQTSILEENHSNGSERYRLSLLGLNKLMDSIDLRTFI
ncbi:TPA: hypothetical protein I7148_11935 [Vibrio vulnificus]|nr:hypothetical protein [Vibrio vulnificus]HAU8251996.1 hypothetical protein [Vibrio vulnificus]